MDNKMAQTTVIGGPGASNAGYVGHNMGYVGANDGMVYQQHVMPTGPPPYSGPGVYPGSYGPPPGVITVAPTATTIIITNDLGTKPYRTNCRQCQANIVSRVDLHPTCRTHCCAVALCFTCLWPCAFIPYCTDDCMGADHYCPNCSAYIGSHNK